MSKKPKTPEDSLLERITYLAPVDLNGRLKLQYTDRSVPEYVARVSAEADEILLSPRNATEFIARPDKSMRVTLESYCPGDRYSVSHLPNGAVSLEAETILKNSPSMLKVVECRALCAGDINVILRYRHLSRPHPVSVYLSRAEWISRRKTLMTELFSNREKLEEHGLRMS